jgi:hypothetical protein
MVRETQRTEAGGKINKHMNVNTLLQKILKASVRFIHFSGLMPVIKRYILPFFAEAYSSFGNTPLPQVKEYDERFKSIAKNTKPIIIGPWLSEVGFEVLYWIPFLTWLVTYYKIDPERIIILSRGGANHWYDNIGGNYQDIFSYFTPEEFKLKNNERIAQTGGQKHFRLTSFDLEILTIVTKNLNIKDYENIHPSVMYELFLFFWRRQVSIRLIEQHTAYRKFAKLPDGDTIGLVHQLPDSYVAVKFYFSDAFPDTPENRRFIDRVVQNLAKTNVIVLLNSGISIDDHDDFTSENSDRIISLGHLDPEKNLDIQTKVLSRAKAFYGTYGGFSYIAPLYGVPSISFYSEPDKFDPFHLEVANRAFRTINSSHVKSMREIPYSHDEPDCSKNSSVFIILCTTDLDLLEDLIK